jgi:hypothetical protein
MLYACMTNETKIFNCIDRQSRIFVLARQKFILVLKECLHHQSISSCNACAKIFKPFLKTSKVFVSKFHNSERILTKFWSSSVWVFHCGSCTRQVHNAAMIVAKDFCPLRPLASTGDHLAVSGCEGGLK